jgi:hypothetical protein
MAATLLAHAAWDAVHLWHNCVVAASYAEFGVNEQNARKHPMKKRLRRTATMVGAAAILCLSGSRF